MNGNHNNKEHLSSFLMNIKKIDSIVIVDDVRTLTPEDMKEIHKMIEGKKESKDENDS